MVGDGNMLYLTLRPGYGYYSYYPYTDASDSSGGAVESPSDSLVVMNLSQDTLDERSHTSNAEGEFLARRTLLKSAMQAQGFQSSSLRFGPSCSLGSGLAPPEASGWR